MENQSFNSNFMQISVPANGSQVQSVGGVDSLYISNSSQAVIGLRVNNGSTSKVPNKTQLNGQQFGGKINTVEFINLDNTNTLTLDFFAVEGGAVGTGDVNISGGIATRKGNSGAIKNIPLVAGTKKQIITADINTNGVLIQCDQDITLYNDNVDTSYWTLPKGSVLSLENGQEYWALSALNNATVEIIQES